MTRGFYGLVLLCSLGFLGFFPQVHAGSSVQPAPITTSEKKLEGEHFYENKKEISLASGTLFSIGNDNSYVIAPILTSYHWQLDDVGLDGWRKGNTEFVFTGYYDQIVQGPENYFAGALFGPRYNFVQPGWQLVPYVEARVGIGFTDSTTGSQVQGQDFCFSFAVSAGARYFVNDHFSLSVAAWYQHWSNGGLSEPGRKNVGLDTVGPVLAATYSF